MTTPAATERAHLGDALEAAGPHAPTLCAGWTALDLAAHLVVRERRPDAAAGIVLHPLAGWGERVRQRYAARPFAELVELVRTGPPRTSPFALPGVDAAVNLGEHFVHTEDVLRGPEIGPEIGPESGSEIGATTSVESGATTGARSRPAGVRVLDPAVEAALWGIVTGRSRLLLRRAHVPVTLATADGREHRVGGGAPAGPDADGVRVVGAPGELVLFLFGRGGHARVTLDGSPPSLAALAAADLRV